MEHKPWPGNAAGAKLTLTTTARKIREARTPEMKAFAEWVVRQAGHAPDARLTNRQCATIFRDYVKKNVRYRPDPPGMELIQSAHITLCVPGTKGEQVCIPVEDCDGHIVALGGLMAAYGMDVHILDIQYGPGIQPHVILEFQDDDGRWVTVDSTPPYPPLGYRPVGKYTVIDPLDPKMAPAGHAQGDFIGYGASAPSAIPYQQVTLPGVAHTGLRYRLGMQVTFGYDPTDQPVAKQGAETYFTEEGFAIESFEAQGPAQLVPGLDVYIQSYILQAIATKEIPLSDKDVSASSGPFTGAVTSVQYLVVGVQSSTAKPPAPGPIVVAPVADHPVNVSLGKAVAVAAGVGVGVGAAVYFWRRYRAAHLREA